MSNAAPISDDEIAELFRGLEGTPLALAVSGGADSMALMHMAARWAKREDVRAAYERGWRDAISRSLGSLMRTQWSGLARPPWLKDIASPDDLLRASGTPHVIVLTVDHGLRNAAAREAVFVSDAARRLGFPCVSLKWEGDKPSSGIQEAARAARRDLMCDVLQAEAGVLCELGNLGRNSIAMHPRRCFVMAHHLEDQAETFLMRLARGSGLEGLGGMRPRDAITREPVQERPDHFTAEVLRPLLDVPKARLVATLQAYGARWVDDPSNEDMRFERVRMRKALAQLGEVGLSADKIGLSARRLRDADEALYGLMGAIRTRTLPKFETPPRLAPHLGDAPFEMRFEHRPYLLVRTLRWLTSVYGGSSRPAELAQLEALAHAMCKPDFAAATLGGCKIELHDFRVTDAIRDELELIEKAGFPRPRRIRIYREGSGEGLPVVPIAPGQSVDWDGRRFTVHAQASAKDVAVIRALGMQGWADLKKRVPGLADLKLPAAAVATLPVVAESPEGPVISYCGPDEVLRHLRKPYSETPDDSVVSAAVWQAWHDATVLAGREYFSIFNLGVGLKW